MADVEIKLKSEFDPAGTEAAVTGVSEVTDATVKQAQAEAFLAEQTSLITQQQNDDAAARVVAKRESFEGLDFEKISSGQLAVKKAQDEVAASTNKLSKETKELATATKDAAAAEQDLAKEARDNEQAINVKTISTRQLLSEVAQISDKLAPAILKLREFAKETGDADLEKLAGGFESLNSAIGLAAQGFAVGGPLGALAGGVIGLAAPSLRDGIDELGKSLQNLSSVQATADGLPAKIEAVKAALQVRNEAESWEQLTRAIDETGRKADDEARIAASRRGLAKVIADEAVRVAKATGAPPEEVAALEKKSRDTDAANSAAALAEEVAAAERKLKAATEKLAIERDKQLVAQVAEVTNQADLQKAKDAVTKAQEAKLTADAAAPVLSIGEPSEVKAARENVEQAQRQLAEATKSAAERTKANADAQQKAADAAEKLADAEKRAASELAVTKAVTGDRSQINKVKAASDDKISSSVNSAAAIKQAADQSEKIAVDALKDVVAALGKGANDPAVKANIAKATEIAKDGVTKGEASQLTATMQQLVTQSAQSETQRSALMKSVLDAIGQATGTMRSQTDVINGHTRAIKDIQTALKK
jgi:hypothetical protein